MFRYNMVTGKYPFDGETIYALFVSISKGDFIIPEYLDPLLVGLIQG